MLRKPSGGNRDDTSGKLSGPEDEEGISTPQVTDTEYRGQSVRGQPCQSRRRAKVIRLGAKITSDHGDVGQTPSPQNREENKTSVQPPCSSYRMNHLSLSELCCLFCCPPCPSKIASKLAFLPPEPTYSLMCDESGSKWTLHLSERADWQYSTREKDAIECFMTRTSRGNRIACMFVRCSPSARYTLLFSHGNAVDLGQMSSFYIGLGSRINCNVFSYDYSGYGASSGKPSEKNLYADVDAAWQALRSRYGIRPESVIVYGQSIGTVPSVDLASRYESAAVVLHSPLTSGMRVAFPDTKKTYCFDAFPK
ncbi:putative abhydrolase domain-containing protein FAM108B1-like [Scophthalmus maximus]|uniref:Alpha/beta hydrolase domain-containing protein 17B n=1 Tax=Scophthalmus maximus TaxID=52904 RepID=A0A2U9BRN1_SCOMX|nr:putative abhydrolase domain-containing protein FAM108B1-like [Scophthalmus maximus]